MLSSCLTPRRHPLNAPFTPRQNRYNAQSHRGNQRHVVSALLYLTCLTPQRHSVNAPSTLHQNKYNAQSHRGNQRLIIDALLYLNCFTSQSHFINAPSTPRQNKYNAQSHRGNQRPIINALVYPICFTSQRHPINAPSVSRHKSTFSKRRYLQQSRWRSNPCCNITKWEHLWPWSWQSLSWSIDCQGSSRSPYWRISSIPKR